MRIDMDVPTVRPKWTMETRCRIGIGLGNLVGDNRSHFFAHEAGALVGVDDLYAVATVRNHSQVHCNRRCILRAGEIKDVFRPRALAVVSYLVRLLSVY